MVVPVGDVVAAVVALAVVVAQAGVTEGHDCSLRQTGSEWHYAHPCHHSRCSWEAYAPS